MARCHVTASYRNCSSPIQCTPILYAWCSILEKNYSSMGPSFLLVVPKSLYTSVLQAMHNDLTPRDLGMTSTLHQARERFYWLKMRATTERYVASCTQCQCYKRLVSTAAGLLHSVTAPRASFEHLGVDLLGPLPNSHNSNRWIVVCIDYLTRYCETAAVHSATTYVSPFMLRSIVLCCRPHELLLATVDPSSPPVLWSSSSIPVLHTLVIHRLTTPK